MDSDELDRKAEEYWQGRDAFAERSLRRTAQDLLAKGLSPECIAYDFVTLSVWRKFFMPEQAFRHHARKIHECCESICTKFSIETTLQSGEELTFGLGKSELEDEKRGWLAVNLTANHLYKCDVYGQIIASMMFTIGLDFLRHQVGTQRFLDIWRHYTIYLRLICDDLEGHSARVDAYETEHFRRA